VVDLPALAREEGPDLPWIARGLMGDSQRWFANQAAWLANISCSDRYLPNSRRMPRLVCATCGFGEPRRARLLLRGRSAAGHLSTTGDWGPFGARWAWAGGTERLLWSKGSFPKTTDESRAGHDCTNLRPLRDRRPGAAVLNGAERADSLLELSRVCIVVWPRRGFRSRRRFVQSWPDQGSSPSLVRPLPLAPIWRPLSGTLRSLHG